MVFLHAPIWSKVKKWRNPKFPTIHLGKMKLYKDLRQNYWWLNMKWDIAPFVTQCLVCQQVKVEHQWPTRSLQPLSILEWKWEHISMDFVTRLPKTLGNNNAIWVIVDWLIKFTHFLPMKVNFSMNQLTFLMSRRLLECMGYLFL